MHEDQIRSAARAALAEVERTADAEAAWAALVERAGRQAPGRGRWLPLAAAAAALAAVVTGGVLLLNRPDQVRTGQPPATTELVSVPPTRPNQILPTTSPAPTSPATTSPATTTAAAPVDPFAEATAVAATSRGVLLGLPDGSWYPTARTEPTTGPAYLVDRWVVQQQLDDVYGLTGDIWIVDPDGARAWAPPGSALTAFGSTRYHLLDAGVVDGTPTMLVSDSDYTSPDTADSRLLRVDIESGESVDLGSFGGWEAGIAGAGIGTTRIGLLRSALTLNYVEVLDPAGNRLFSHELTPDTLWSLSVVGDRAWVFGGRTREISTFLGPQTEYYVEIIEIDLRTFAMRATEVVIPTDDERNPICWPTRYDGVALSCTTARGPIEFGSGWRRTVPGVTQGIVTARRGAPRPIPSELLTGFRPYFDPELCQPVTAHSEPGGETGFWQPFARGLTPFTTYQFYGDPEVGAGGTFALVAVYDDPSSAVSEPNFVASNGLRASITAARTGWTSVNAEVELPDGRDAYVRTYGFTPALMEQLISALTLRPADAEIPGFDYDPELGPPGMHLIHEQLPQPWLVGTVHRLRCTQGATFAPNGVPIGEYSVWSIAGDLMYQFLSVLDRPYPLDVGHRDGSVLILHGPDTPGHPTIADVIEAPTDAWLDLLDEPWPDGQL